MNSKSYQRAFMVDPELWTNVMHTNHENLLERKETKFKSIQSVEKFECL